MRVYTYRDSMLIGHHPIHRRFLLSYIPALGLGEHVRGLLRKRLELGRRVKLEQAWDWMTVVVPRSANLGRGSSLTGLHIAYLSVC